MSACQKCRNPISASHGRWMFVPQGVALPPGFTFDKCQSCGEWTPAEQAIVTAKVKQIQAQQQKMSGCNCTGKR